MTSDRSGRSVVVGYDGSPASRVALQRAAERAGAGGTVYVVHAYPLPGALLGYPYDQRLLESETADVDALMEGVQQHVRVEFPEVDWVMEPMQGDAARAIADVAAVRHAAEIVVGTRGFGRARALLGSVSHELIHLAECPVTVIPERAVERLEAAGPTPGAPAAGAA